MVAEVKPALRCRDVTKTYGKGETAVKALRGVNLEVPKGEMLMLVGPSGCGKTTLISILAGILEADGGECEVFGRDFRTESARAKTEFRKVGVGFVFQSLHLIPNLSIAENVAAPLLINEVPRRRALHQAEEMLARVGLEGRGQALPAEISGGQKQRVAIARALVHRPDMMVCDEPTSALDGDTGQQILELMKTLSVEDGRTSIVVTHDSRIYHFADRTARMEDGRILEVVDGPLPD